MAHPEVILLLVTTALGMPFGPTFTGYFREGFPFSEVASRIAAWTPESPQNVWELSGQYEGDIMLPAEKPGAPRNIILNEETRWPDAELPYYIDPVFSEKEREVIIGALEEFNKKTCVKLVPYEEDKGEKEDEKSSEIRILPIERDDEEERTLKSHPATYIWIQGADTGCWSMVGRQNSKGVLAPPQDGDNEVDDYDTVDEPSSDDAPGNKNRNGRSFIEVLLSGFLSVLTGDKGPGKGGQVVNLQRPGCVHHGVVVHEVLHALGFFHQQSAHNRDQFVEIHWENISEGKESNFNKYNSSVVTDYGVPYDYSSVMHYGRTAFSKNGNDTIVPAQKDAKIGQRAGMSDGDAEKLIKAYCENQESTTASGSEA